jgi:hypothetical protein
MSTLFDVCWIAAEPKYAPEVQALLQSLRARDGGDDVHVAPAASADVVRSGGRRRNNNGGVVWDEDEYDAFMAADKDSYRRVRAFADVLAASPGEPFTTTRVTQTAGITPSQLRAALGKFTTWMSANIEDEQWPFGWAYGEDVDPENPGEFHYQMSDGQAAAWRAARDRAAESE